MLAVLIAADVLGQRVVNEAAIELKQVLGIVLDDDKEMDGLYLLLAYKTAEIHIDAHIQVYQCLHRRKMAQIQYRLLLLFQGNFLVVVAVRMIGV